MPLGLETVPLVHRLFADLIALGKGANEVRARAGELKSGLCLCLRLCLSVCLPLSVSLFMAISAYRHPSL